MSTTTSPDNIVAWDQSDPASIAQESQSQATSIQNALLKRMRFDFVWDDTAERNAQTGMEQGSRGYQIDTRTEYLYDSGTWRLGAAFIRGTSSTGSINTGVAAFIGTPTLDATATTDTTLGTFGASNITLAQPGIYSIQFTGKENGSNANGGQSQLVISTANNFSDVPGRLSNSMFSGALMSTCVLPFFRATAANTVIYFFYYNDAGAARTMNCTVAVGRLA